MCGKAAVSGLQWKDIFAWANLLRPPHAYPPDPEDRVNISPSRLRRLSEPDSMIWETLPVISAGTQGAQPSEALWPFIPHWANGQLPRNRAGKLISTANARLRREGAPFAPTFMPAWRNARRVLVVVSWFYEFDSRVRPQTPYAVFPLAQPFWMMAGLASEVRLADGTRQLSVAVVTVEPNQVLQSVGHFRSPALLCNPQEAERWLHAPAEEAVALLRPYPEEFMGVEEVDPGIKIPGNQVVRLPERLLRRSEI